MQHPNEQSDMMQHARSRHPDVFLAALYAVEGWVGGCGGLQLVKPCLAQTGRIHQLSCHAITYLGSLHREHRDCHLLQRKL